jgi:hypothetical protein
MRNKGVDVEQVMEEVNRAVAAPDTLLADFWKEERIKAPNLTFLYPPYSKTLMVNLDLVSRNWEIDSEFELGSRRRLTGKPAVAFKRVTRASLRWYVNPIVHQVRKFNMLVTRTLHDLANNLDELRDRVARLEKAETESRVAELEEKLRGLEEKAGGE